MSIADQTEPSTTSTGLPSNQPQLCEATLDLKTTEAPLLAKFSRVRASVDSLLMTPGDSLSSIVALQDLLKNTPSQASQFVEVALNHLRQGMPGTSAAVVQFLPDLLNTCAPHHPQFFKLTLDELVPRLGGWPRLQTQVSQAALPSYLNDRAQNNAHLHKLIDTQLENHRYRILDSIGFIIQLGLHATQIPGSETAYQDAQALLNKISSDPRSSCAAYLMCKSGLQKFESLDIAYKRISTWDFPESKLFLSVDRDACRIKASLPENYGYICAEVQKLLPHSVRIGERTLRDFPELASHRSELIAKICERLFDWSEVSFERFDRSVDRDTRYERALVPLTFIQSVSIDRYIVEQFNIPARGLSINERFFMVSLLAAIPNPELPRVVQFFRSHAETGVRSLFTLEYEVAQPDLVLLISERAGTDSAHSLFSAFSQFTDDAKLFKNTIESHAAFDSLSADVRSTLAKDIHEGLLRRGRDVLAAAATILGDTKSNLHFRDAERALQGLHIFIQAVCSKNLQTCSSTSLSVVPNSNSEPSHFAFNLVDAKSEQQYRLKVFTRPISCAQGEARVNIELEFNTEKPNIELRDAFSTTVRYRRSGEKQVSSLRVALDLDSHQDPACVSLDVGRSAFVSKRLTALMVSRDADVLGKLFDLSNKNGSHTVESFDPVLATPKTFAEVVHAFRRYFGTFEQ